MSRIKGGQRLNVVRSHLLLNQGQTSTQSKQKWVFLINKKDKTEYQRLQIIKESLISSTVNSPTKSPRSIFVYNRKRPKSTTINW